ncbi:hypothetical protein BRD00_03790 [Halobacteriales archaeon QS_8_69_26]|nr:MAG: hypothetical protein BRD00_03790 [Halobacteriales archaeon QS_8_69_26]
MSDNAGGDPLRRRAFLALCGTTALAGCAAPSGDGGTSVAETTDGVPTTTRTSTGTTAGTTDRGTTATTDSTETTQGTTETPDGPSLSIDPAVAWRMHGADAANTGVLDTAGPGDRPEKVWDVPVEGIYTLPGAVYDDGVGYVGSGKEFYAVDVAAGEERWTAPVDYLAHHFSPAVADGRVFVSVRSLDGVRSGGGEGVLYAFDAASGTVDWRVDMPVSSPPTVADGTVYVTRSEDVGVLHAFDAASGNEQWSFRFAPDGKRGSIYGAPAVVDGTIYATASAHGNDVQSYLYALEGGNVRWRYGIDAETRVPPVIRDDEAYVATASGELHAVGLGGDDRWSVDGPGAIFSTPAVDEERIYALAKGELVALSREDGSETWRTATGDQLINGLAVTGDGVYLGGSDVLALDRDDGSRRWRFPIPGDSGGYGAPVVLDGAVLVGACIKWEPRDPYDDHVFALA